MVADASSTPIIRTYTPRRADADAMTNMAVIEAALASGKKVELLSLLIKADMRALLIVLNYDEETSEEFLMYFVEGRDFLSGFALSRLGAQVSRILGIGESLSFTLDSEAGSRFARDYDIGLDDENPVNAIFASLDSGQSAI